MDSPNQRGARPRIDVNCSDWDAVAAVVKEATDANGIFVDAIDVPVDTAVVVRLHLPDGHETVMLPGLVGSQGVGDDGSVIRVDFEPVLPKRSRATLDTLLSTGGAPLPKVEGPDFHQALYVHPLPNVHDFRGRTAELNALGTRWPRGCLVSIVGQGGEGKSTLLAKMLENLQEHMEPPHAVFVWSFYQDTDADAFLKSAIFYLTGKESTASGTMGHVYALADALKKAGRVLLALDGLERIQETGAKAEVEDPALRLLLEQMAVGQGSTMAVVTTRRALPGLEEYLGSGYFELQLQALSPDAANQLLWDRGVKADFKQLSELNQRFGGHALTVSLLGSLIANFYKGDVAGVAGLRPGESQSERLGIVLSTLERCLTPEEAGIIERLSAFRSGSTYRMLDEVFVRHTAGDRLQRRLLGPIGNLTSATLKGVLDHLEALHLIAHEGEEDGEPVYAFHAAVKDHFYSRLMSAGQGTRIHEQVQEHLAARPMEQRPVSDHELDLIEGLIHHTAKAGHLEKAFKIYWERLNGYDHLGRTLGAYARGRRITQGFIDAPGRLDEWKSAMVVGDHGLYLEKLGDFDGAMLCHDRGLRMAQKENDHANSAIALLNQAKIALIQGRLPKARQQALEARRFAKEAERHRERWLAFSVIGLAEGLMGNIGTAESAFKSSKGSQGKTGLRSPSLVDRPGIRHALFLIRQGKIQEAKEVTMDNLELCEQRGWSQSVVRCQLVLGDICMAEGDVLTAQAMADEALSYATQWGWLEAIAWGQRLRAQTMATSANNSKVLEMLEDAQRTARRGPFALQEIETLLSISRISPPEEALEAANKAVSLAGNSAHYYRWGELDGMIARARAKIALGDRVGARDDLQRTLGPLQELAHPQLGLVESALERL